MRLRQLGAGKAFAIAILIIGFFSTSGTAMMTATPFSVSPTIHKARIGFYFFGVVVLQTMVFIKEWSLKSIDALANLMKQTGMSSKDFEACLNDQKLYNKVVKERDDAGKDFSIDATPTFFINGVKYSGEMSVAALSKILDPLVAKK